MSGGNILASGIGDVDDRFFNRIFVDGQSQNCLEIEGNVGSMNVMKAVCDVLRRAMYPYNPAYNDVALVNFKTSPPLLMSLLLKCEEAKDYNSFTLQSGETQFRFSTEAPMYRNKSAFLRLFTSALSTVVEGEIQIPGIAKKFIITFRAVPPIGSREHKNPFLKFVNDKKRVSNLPQFSLYPIPLTHTLRHLSDDVSPGVTPLRITNDSLCKNKKPAQSDKCRGEIDPIGLEQIENGCCVLGHCFEQGRAEDWKDAPDGPLVSWLKRHPHKFPIDNQKYRFLTANLVKKRCGRSGRMWSENKRIILKDQDISPPLKKRRTDFHPDRLS
jgi:hypothetical protein